MAATRQGRPLKNADLSKKICDIIRKCDYERTFLPVELSSLQTILKDELNNQWIYKVLYGVYEECAILPQQCRLNCDQLLTDTVSLKELQEEKEILTKRTAILQHHTSRHRKKVNEIKDKENNLQVQIHRNRLISCEENVHKLLSASANFTKGLNVDIYSFIEKATQYLAQFECKSFFGIVDDKCHTVATLSFINGSIEKVGNKEKARLVCILNQLDISLHKLELVLCSFLLNSQKALATWTGELRHMADECNGHKSILYETTDYNKQRRKVAEAVKAKRLLDQVRRRPQIGKEDEWDRELSWWRCFLDTR